MAIFAEDQMLVCQISDLHIRLPGQLCYGVVDSALALSSCLDAIRALPQVPDVVLMTGDLVDSGSAGEYRHLASFIDKIAQPVYLIPGNHDDREVMREAFPNHAYLGPGGTRVNYAIDCFPLRIVAIDTVMPGQSGGIFTAASAAWLDETLALRPTTPTLVMMHHPPFRVGIGHMDDIGLLGSEILHDVVARHDQIERIICGHLHRDISTRFAGTIASTCPSPAHQVMLDLDAHAASRFVMEPPGYQLHLFHEGQGLVTHSAAIGRFAGPYAFPGDDSPTA
jgi:3',5'-cyclic AMP phosphodiesterase CpdA